MPLRGKCSGIPRWDAVLKRCYSFLIVGGSQFIQFVFTKVSFATYKGQSSGLEMKVASGCG